MNRTLKLIRYAKLDSGWRRGAVVLTRNGKLKHPYMKVAGRETEAEQGRYKIVRYEGNKPIYTDLGNDPVDALARYRAEEMKLNARRAAGDAGLSIAEPEPEPKTRTLKQDADAFLRMHKSLPHRSDDSVRVYTQVTTTFLAHCQCKAAADVTQTEVINWYGAMKDKGYSDRTRANLYLSLRGFLRYCGVDPAKIIDRGTHKLLKQYTRKTPNMYTPEQVQALIDASTDSNRALLWDFLYKTGLRDSEVQMVTRHDLHGLDTEQPMLHVKERDEYGRIKDAEERELELHPTLVAPIKAWLKENPGKTLLFGTMRDKPDTKMLLALKVTARRAGLNPSEFTLHRFRRTYVSRMLVASGGDLRSVMMRSGHSDLQSVMRYLAPSATMRAALSQAF